MSPPNVHETLRGRRLLVTGATGFVGKVWVAMLLDRVPEVGHLYVLIRGKGRTAAQRFERMLNTSPAFKPLHERHGARLGEYLASRLTVLEGDVGQPNLGLSEEVAARLAPELDAVINFAGLVDFNPDLRDALSSNVDGAVHVADFAARCDHAGVLHVSTCYVCGQREGLIPESLDPHTTPNGQPFDVHEELARLRTLVADTIAAHDSPEIHDEIREQIVERIQRRGLEPRESRIRAMVQRMHRRRVKEALIQAGTDRAQELGWPNTYTFTKAMAEALLADRAHELRVAVLRPAIVESAERFPFPGWNEGFNTSGPLVYLAGTWLRHIPARYDNKLDVIPVDHVCRGLTVATVALLRGEQRLVYHCGTSDINPLRMERIFELSSLAHRKHLRTRGSTRAQRVLQSRWDIIQSTPEGLLTVRNIRRAVHQVNRFMRHGLPLKIPHEVRERADELADKGEDAERRLRQIEDVMDLFQPFIHDHDFTFECCGLRDYRVEEPEFVFDPGTIEWRSYWMNVHMPGLRRWCFPEYEGKERESYRAPEPVHLVESDDIAGVAVAAAPGAGAAAAGEPGGQEAKAP